MDWSRLPPLAALRAYEAAARHKGFAAAARELNVTHAAISQQVRALEDRLGLPLLQREGRGLALSAEGAQLSAGLTEGFGRIAEVLDDVTGVAAARPLQISTTPSFASRWLMPRIGDFLARHPEIAFALRPEEKLVDLAADRIDLAIRFGTGAWPGMTAELLLPTRFVVAGAPALLGGRTTLNREEMAALPWVVEDSWPEQAVMMQTLGLDLARLRRIDVTTGDLAITAARAGHGLSVLVGPLAEADIADGRLIALFRGGADGRGYFLCTRPGPVKPALRVFVRWLRSQAQCFSAPSQTDQ